MVELLGLDFIQRAFLAAIGIGLLCSVLGVFITLRGLAFIGAGTAHAAFAGVAFGYLIGVEPLLPAFLFGLVTVWTIGYLYQRGRMRLDVTIAIFYTLTMALAIVFIGLMRSYNSELYGYLFGSILAVTPQDLVLIGALLVLVLSSLFLFYKEFHAIVFDHDMAEASGIPTWPLFYLLLTLTALTIVGALKTVGALLVFAMLLIPPATAGQWARTFQGMMWLSVTIGIGSAIGGVFLSIWLDLPSGATIVILATTLFFLSIALRPRLAR